MVVAVGLAMGSVAVAQPDRHLPAPAVTPSPAPSTVPSTPPPSASAIPPLPPPSRSVSPSTTSPATTRPSSRAPGGPITDDSFLQPADVGSGYRANSDQEQGDWTWEFSASMLRCERPDPYYQEIERRQRALEGVDGSVVQYVARYRAGDAAGYLR